MTPAACAGILLEADLDIREAWQAAAARDGRQVLIFSSLAAFFAQAFALDRSVPIFIARRLEDSDGETAILKLAQGGFSNLYFITSDPTTVSAETRAHLQSIKPKFPTWGREPGTSRKYS